MRKYQYWLSNIPGIGNRTIHHLIQMYGDAREVYFSKESRLQAVPKLSKTQQESILESKKTWDLERQEEKLQESGISFFCIENDDFPEKIRNIYDAPYSFYCKGKLPDQKEKSIAIVGARRCSEYGRAVALELGEKFAKKNVSVISGMALGIDAFGHWGAIRGKGKTYAVLGCGVDVCYPPTNRSLYEKILQTGGIISEYPIGTQPVAKLFPARNRLISAFSDAVIVVEARRKSGSLITADFALEQGKDIYAVPGGIYDDLSLGCNDLIRQGAGIVTGANALLTDLNFTSSDDMEQLTLEKILLEKHESLVYSCVDLRPRSIDELLRKTGLSVQELILTVTALQEKNLIEESFKNYYIRRN